MRNLTFLIPLLSLAVLLGCSSPLETTSSVAQEKIFQNYMVYFDESRNWDWVIAEFRTNDSNGKPLALAAGSQVTHNIYPLTQKVAQGAYYTGQGQGFKADHVFTFIDGDGHKNTAAITNTAASLPAALPVLKRSAGGVITWTGSPLQPGETVTAAIGSAIANDFIRVSASAVGAVQITLSSDQIKLLVAGDKNISLTRERTAALPASTGRNGMLKATYVTLSRTITVTE